MKLVTELLIGFLMVALLSAVGGFVAVALAQNALEDAVGAQLETATGELISEVDETIHHRVEELQLFSTRLLLRQNVIKSNDEFAAMPDRDAVIAARDEEWKAAETLTPFMRQTIENNLSNIFREVISFYEKTHGYVVFTEMYITNAYGVIAYSSGQTNDYLQADEEWWQETKRKDIFVQDVEYDESSRSHAIQISVAVKDATGNFVGAVKAKLNIKDIINRLETSAENLPASSTRLHLFTREGKLIYASGNQHQPLQDLSSSLPFTLGSSQSRFEYDDGGTRKFATSAHSQGDEGFRGFGWLLVVDQDDSEIHASIRTLRQTLMLIILATLVIACVLSFVLARMISKPLVRMSRALQIMREGNIPPAELSEGGTNRETQELASQFRQTINAWVEHRKHANLPSKETTERKEGKKRYIRRK